MRAGGHNEPERPFLPVSQHLIPCLQAVFSLSQSLSFFVSRVLLLLASDFVRQLRLLASLPDFHSKEGETGISSNSLRLAAGMVRAGGMFLSISKLFANFL